MEQSPNLLFIYYLYFKTKENLSNKIDKKVNTNKKKRLDRKVEPKPFSFISQYFFFYIPEFQALNTDWILQPLLTWLYVPSPEPTCRSVSRCWPSRRAAHVLAR